MDFVEKIRALAAEVPRSLPAAKRSEASTSQFLVMPFFELLGFNVHNPNDVEPEFTADVGILREKVDFALKRDGKAVILVEVKYAGATLDKQHAEQLRRYFSTKLDVRFGILTNGLEFRFFADLDNPNVMDDEPFMTLDMLKLDESLIDVLQLFAKVGLHEENALEAARMSKDRLRVRHVLRAEFEPLSQRMMNNLADIIEPRKTSQSRLVRLKELIGLEWQEFLRSRLKAPECEPGITVAQLSPAPVTPKQASDLRGREIPVFGTHEGNRFEAELLREYVAEKGIYPASKCMRFRGKITNCAVAALEAIHTVNPNYEYVRGKFNAFSFWKVIDPSDGNEREMWQIAFCREDDTLLRRVLDGM